MKNHLAIFESHSRANPPIGRAEGSLRDKNFKIRRDFDEKKIV